MKARPRRRRRSSTRSSRPPPAPLVSADSAGHEASRALCQRQGRSVRRPEQRGLAAHTGGIAGRTAHDLRHRQRADDEPAGGDVSAAPRRRQGSRHARRPHRSDRKPLEKESRAPFRLSSCVESTTLSSDALRQTSRRPAPSDHHHAELSRTRRRIGPDRSGPHARDLHGERRGSGAAVSPQQRQGLGDGRVRDAAARDEHAHAARSERRAKSADARRRFSG